MFEPLLEILEWLKSLVPDTFKPGRPHFNFITVHYCYMVGLSILGSIILYPGGLLTYTNALFLSAGAATQSGLNPIDINKLKTYQQVTLMLMACIANPIFINTMVVFIRLYWFEQRFTHIVKEAQRARRTRTRSRTVSESRQETDPVRLEAGVNGRPITVLHHTTLPNGLTQRNANNPLSGMSEKDRVQHLAGSIAATPPGGSSESGQSSNDTRVPDVFTSSGPNNASHDRIEAARSDCHTRTSRRSMSDIAPDEKTSGSEHGDHEEEENEDGGGHWLGHNPMLRRDIMFADEVRPGTPRRPRLDDDDRLPGQKSDEHHIAFLQKQRDTKNTGTLRIPGPRDFDRGDKPHELGDDLDDNGLQKSMTRNTLPGSPPLLPQRKPTDDVAELNEDDHPQKRNITINVPDEHPRHDQDERKRSTASSRSHRFNVLAPILRLRSKAHHDGPGIVGRSLSALKSRTMSFTKSQERDLSHPMPYLSWQPTLGRNSMFLDLTEERREELGGIEYRSLKTLAIVLICYFVGFHVLGAVVFVPWIVRSSHWGPIITNDGQNRVWWGIFTPASMFNDLGFTLTPDSMISFQTAVMPLLFGSFLIIIGNTGFPCMLRFVIWVLSKLAPRGSGLWEEFKFLLDHPRRCFTLMFPSKATWWLFWILVLLNGIDLIFFIILDLNDSAVTVLSPGYRVLSGWFQAASTRTAGFSVINLADLHPAIQVSYLIMMYISVFPIAISVRRTNVYEEKSLGLWGGEDEDEDEEGRSYVGQHLRRQLSFDLWYIFLGLFIIAICEGSRLEDPNKYAFNLFAVLFEIVSAYGTVGLSLGYPNINASFSTTFSNISKLIIIAMMIRGRHRGLPYALDRAILLPSDNLRIAEEEEAKRRNALFGDGVGEEGEDGAPGLPRHHTMNRRTSTMQQQQQQDGGAGAGTGLRHLRRGSELSTTSKRSTDPMAGGTPSGRSRRRFSTVVMAGLSAGPTIGNRKHE
ncbi:hypothetical protein AAFC00_003223 [Neodothiora populina]